MPNINSLKRQHQDIESLIGKLEDIIHADTLDENALQISKSINELSGRLKIHLSHEDKYLYPKFKKSEHIDLKNKAESYIKEMGDLNEVFNCYKNRFNTKTKILKEPKTFIDESELIFFAIKKRISKEDDDLYLLAKNL
jgi:iron-sulfur cluster repair protein YtfE (RIC family)